MPLPVREQFSESQQATMPKATYPTADEWFQTKCDQLGINPDDLVHPGDVDHTEAEWLIGARVLHYEPSGTGKQRDDFVVDDIDTLPTGRSDEEVFAIYYYEMGNPRGMNIEATREELEEWSLQVRFIPDNVEVKTQSAEAAIERLRGLKSSVTLYGDQAEDLAEALGGEIDREGLYEDSLSVPTFLQRVVGQLTDEESISAREYFGKSITGHKKSDRGVYKANLTVLEEHFGMEPTYERKR